MLISIIPPSVRKLAATTVVAMLLGNMMFATLPANARTSTKKTTAATTHRQASHPWHIIFGMGLGHYHTGTHGETFQVTNIETDELVQQHQSTSLFSFLGVQYFMPLRHKDFTGVSIGPMMTYQPVHFRGEINQFQSPLLNNFTYNYHVQLWNLYLETALYFAHLSLGHLTITPYVLLGAGASIVRLSYAEQVAPGAPANSTRNGSGWDQVPSFELGAGVNIPINHHWYLGGRYVFQHPSRASLSLSNTPGPIRVNLTSSSGYAVLGYQFG